MTISALRACCLTVLLAAVPGWSARAVSQVNVYLSAPFTQTAGSSGLANADGSQNTNGFANTSTEPFNQTASDTYTSLTSSALTVSGQAGNTMFAAATGDNFSVKANSAGYGGGGQGNYLSVPSKGALTLTFNSPVGYFGLLWCAVDAGNSLTFYDQNNVAIGTLNATVFSNKLPTGGTVTALNGTTYNTNDYYGQPTGTNVAGTPTSRTNGNQQYAYLDFVGLGGTTISKIVENQGASGGFESDNYALIVTAPTVNSTTNGSVVFVSSVPEPATWTLAIVAGGLVLLGVRRRRCVL